MMRRAIGLLVTLALAILWAPGAATAQPPATISRIGVLAAGAPGDRGIAAFLQGLRDPGYVEGQNIFLESRYANWQIERLPDLAAELVQLNPDVLFTSTTPRGLASKRATTTVPIVVVGTGLVDRDVVASLGRPGENMTGITLLAEVYGKQLELLKESAPHIARVAMLVNSANPGANPYPASLAAEARALGVQLRRIEVRAPGEFEGAFAAIAEGRADVLLVPSDAMFGMHRHQITALAATHRLPSISRSAGFAEAGGLMQYGEDSCELNRRAATYVDKILKGAKPADLPVEQFMKFEFVINLKTAQSLGLTIPPCLLFQATEVIR